MPPHSHGCSAHGSAFGEPGSAKRPRVASRLRAAWRLLELATRHVQNAYFGHRDQLERGRGQKGPWEAPTRERYERVVRQQVRASADPTRRPLGETKLRDVTVDRVAAWSQGNEQALAPSMAQLALIALNQVFRYAVRRGWVGVNPVAQLEPGEKPRWRVEHVRMLEGADLAKLLEHAGPCRPLFEFLAYTGLRIGEALGLRWCDVDSDAGVLRVRQQLSRHAH